VRSKNSLTHSPVLGLIIGFVLGMLGGNIIMAFVMGFFGAFIQMIIVAKPRFHVAGEKGEGFLKSEQDFLKNIMALAALVIRSDGKDAYHELSFIEARLRKEFSQDFVPVAMSHMRAELTRPSTLKTHTDRIAFEFDNTAKIQLMHFLISICTVDGVMTQNELKTLRDISMRIELSQKSLDAIIAMFRFRNEQQQQQYNRTTKVSTSMLDDAYKIIGVSSTSGDSEIKKAYKKLAIAHHPDKFAHKGDLAQKNAAEKFKVIVGAYDLICKKRGIV
jgi:DnaJ like chaperone protein